jgi:AcrR family transcriptional regulator
MNLSDRIFYGAIEEFRENGVKFTMDSLAVRLGISKRTLYENVSSKNALIEIVIDRTFADVKKQQKVIFDNQGIPLVDKLKKLFVIIPSYADIIDYRRTDEIRTAYPKLYKKVHDNINNDWERTIDLLQEGMDAGIIKRKNIVILKAVLCGLFEKLLDGTFLIKNNITYEMAIKEIISIIFDGILEDNNNAQQDTP